jgi:hypothetical protein
MASRTPNPANAIWGEVNKAVNKGTKAARAATKTVIIYGMPGVGAGIKGAKAAKAAAKAIAKKKPYVKVTTGTQAKNANITLKAAKGKKSGSPKPGTKVRVQKVVNPRQGAAGQAAAAGRAADKKAKAIFKPIAGFVAGWEANKDLSKIKNNKKK